jgi:transcriptional regulator with XRE-family HTH domain
VANGAGSTVVRRQLGRKLRRLREDAGKTHADVEAARIASATKMWRIESGKAAVKPGDVWALANLYEVGPEITSELAKLAADTSEEGWIEEYAAAVPDWLGLYAGLEVGSSFVWTYHPELVPGLLQTRDYAYAVIRSDHDLPDDIVEQRLAFRLERQKAVLARGRIVAVLGAGALALEVGSRDVMAAQIEHLRDLGRSDRVDVRILPWSAGAHPSMKGAFTILDFEDPEDPALVYVEAHVGSRFMAQDGQVAEYRRIFGLLRERAVSIERYEP